MPRDDEIDLSAETIHSTAETLDINAHMVEKYNQLEKKIAALKIMFEAHKISRKDN